MILNPTDISPKAFQSLKNKKIEIGKHPEDNNLSLQVTWRNFKIVMIVCDTGKLHCTVISGNVIFSGFMLGIYVRMQLDWASLWA